MRWGLLHFMSGQSLMIKRRLTVSIFIFRSTVNCEGRGTKMRYGMSLDTVMYRHVTYGLLSLGKNTFVIIRYEVFLVMWRRVIGWLVPNVSRQCGGLVFKGRTVEVAKAELKSQSSQRTGLPLEMKKYAARVPALELSWQPPQTLTSSTDSVHKAVLAASSWHNYWWNAVLRCCLSAHTARPTQLSAAYRAVILDAWRSKHSCDFQELLVSVINSINVCPSKDAAIVYKKKLTGVCGYFMDIYS
jgi:hypothetical protein